MKKICIILVVMVMFASIAKSINNLKVYRVYFFNNHLTAEIKNDGKADYKGDIFMRAIEDGKTDVKETVLPDWSLVSKSSSFHWKMFDRNVKCTIQLSIDGTNWKVFNYDPETPQIHIMSDGGYVPVADTTILLPGEMLHNTFWVNNLNMKYDIIGIRFLANYGNSYYVPSHLLDVNWFLPASNDNYLGGNYYSNISRHNRIIESNWMANSSKSALNMFWLGTLDGTSEGVPIGKMMEISGYLVCSTLNLKESHLSFKYLFKVVDRIRGDVNDDGVVDNSDLTILVNAVNNGLYNHYDSYREGMSAEHGINYAAGIVLFNRPDFISNTLINIWIHDKNDPLVKDLGIGELMSVKKANPVVESVKNTFSLVDRELIIDSPEADFYNITGSDEDGSLFQKTGRINEVAVIPEGVQLKSIKVETVSLNTDISTLNLSQNETSSTLVYPSPMTDYFNIKTNGSGLVKVFSLDGRTMFSDKFAGSENIHITTSDWHHGIYIVNLTNSYGQIENIKISK